MRLFVKRAVECTMNNKDFLSDHKNIALPPLDGRRWRPATLRPRMTVRTPSRAPGECFRNRKKMPGAVSNWGKSVRRKGERAPNGVPKHRR